MKETTIIRPSRITDGVRNRKDWHKGDQTTPVESDRILIENGRTLDQRLQNRRYVETIVSCEDKFIMGFLQETFVMLNRREILQVGASSFFGMSLTGVLQRQAMAAGKTARAKSVLLVFLPGGGSHLDMFDPKPLAPEIKGEFGTIATTLPGIHFSDKMPQLAARTGKLAIVRSMAHGDNRHLSGSHNALTGALQPFRGNSNQDKSLNRNDWPSYGSVVSLLRPRADRLPNQITLPNPLIEGTLIWPGQHAGFLDPRFDPFVLNDDPSKKN